MPTQGPVVGPEGFPGKFLVRAYCPVVCQQGFFCKLLVWTEVLGRKTS